MQYLIARNTRSVVLVKRISRGDTLDFIFYGQGHSLTGSSCALCNSRHGLQASTIISVFSEFLASCSNTRRETKAHFDAVQKGLVADLCKLARANAAQNFVHASSVLTYASTKERSFTGNIVFESLPRSFAPQLYGIMALRWLSDQPKLFRSANMRTVCRPMCLELQGPAQHRERKGFTSFQATPGRCRMPVG